MANANVNMGGMYDAGTAVNTLTLTSRRGSILNRGAATVYGTWDNAAGPAAADGTAEAGKFMLASGDACRIPVGTKIIGYKTAAATAVLMVVCD